MLKNFKTSAATSTPRPSTASPSWPPSAAPWPEPLDATRHGM